MHKNVTDWEDKDQGNEPKLPISKPFGHALKSLESSTVSKKEVETEASGPAPMIVVTIAAVQTSSGWDPWAGTLDMRAPDKQRHCMMGLRLEGMSEIGWIASKKEVWDINYDCPREIIWANMTLVDEVGKSLALPPY